MDTPSGANAVSRRKGYLQLSSQAQSRKGYAHFPTKSGLTGGAKQCIVQKNKGFLLQNGGKRAIL